MMKMILANLMIILGKKDEIDIKPSQEKISQFFLSAHDRQAKSTLFFHSKNEIEFFSKGSNFYAIHILFGISLWTVLNSKKHKYFSEFSTIFEIFNLIEKIK